MFRTFAILAGLAVLALPQKSDAQFRLSTNVGGAGCVGGYGGAGGAGPLLSREIIEERREVIERPILVPFLAQSGCFNLGGGVQGRSILDSRSSYGYGGSGRSVGGFGGFGGINVNVQNRGGLLGRSSDINIFDGRRGIDLNVQNRGGILSGRRGGLGSLGLGGGILGRNTVSVDINRAETQPFRFAPRIELESRSGLLGRNRTRVLID